MWDSLAPGGVANYTCDPGFVLVGDHTRICGSDGTWSGMAPTCARKLILAQYHLHYYLGPNINSLVDFVLPLYNIGSGVSRDWVFKHPPQGPG